MEKKRREREVWPPGSADTVCPRRPLMTQVQDWAKTAQTDYYVTLQPRPLTLEVTAPVAYAGRRHPSKFEVRRPCHSEDMADDVMCVTVNGPGITLIFDL